MVATEISYPTQAFINGAWVQAEGGATFRVENPSNGEVIAHVPDMGQTETRQAIEAAAAALPIWREKPSLERADVLRRIGQFMMADQERLARLMTLEQGKPLEIGRAHV